MPRYSRRARATLYVTALAATATDRCPCSCSCSCSCSCPCPTPPDPLADYAFTGLVTVDGEPHALLEHKTTREGVYLSVGDEFQGFRVSRVDREAVTLSRAMPSRAVWR